MAEISQGNFILLNEGRGVLTGFNFMLRVEALFDMPLKSVRSFSRELEFDYIQEGGLNDYVHMRRKGISKPFTFEIDRYVGINYIDPLPLGANLLLPLVLMVSRIPGQFMPLVSARTYTFTGCTVTKKSYGELDGNKAELLVETVTIAYRELVVLDAPWSEPLGEAWDNASKSSKAATAENDEEEYRKRCDAVIKEAEPLQETVDSYTAKQEAMLAKMPDGNDSTKTEEQNKKDKEAKKEAAKPYENAKKAVEDASQSASSAKSFTKSTGLGDLTDKAEDKLANAKAAVEVMKTALG